MHAPTTTIETVAVIRPLKVISLICLVLAFFLLIVCLSTTSWLQTDGFRTGLFQECSSFDQPSTPLPNAPKPGECGNTNLSRVINDVVAGANVAVDAVGTKSLIDLLANTAYTSFITIENAAGLSPPLVIRQTTPPDPVTAVTTSEVTGTSMTVSWTAPVPLGTAELSYRVTCTFAGFATEIRTVTGSITLMVLGLKSGIPYDITVMAFNSAGDSSVAAAFKNGVTTLVVLSCNGPVATQMTTADRATYDIATNACTSPGVGQGDDANTLIPSTTGNNFPDLATCQAACIAPDPPTAVDSTNVGKNGFTLNWVAPVAGAVGNYLVELDPSPGSDFPPNVPSGTTTLIVIDLSPNTLYTATIVSETVAGSSRPLTIEQTTLPGQVTNVLLGMCLTVRSRSLGSLPLVVVLRRLVIK